ncbi:MAG: PilC/PilY family type IV pilus protein [Collimonas sp.]|uniref:pilus assembly protein n=1 Tax=Collimonas sp. TaxID=1963772 RepID=UPI0032638C3D
MNQVLKSPLAPYWLASLAFTGLMLGCAHTAQAQTALSDTPLFSSVSVPSNVLLALSVEYPTALSRAHTAAYSSGTVFIGYFDPDKCYDFDNQNGYFVPQKAAASHACSGQWSGNFLNWATTPTIDPFRWALTGGYRLIDTATTTVLQKGYMSNQAAASKFPVQAITNDATTISGATPFTGWSNIYVRVYNFATSMRVANRNDWTAIAKDDIPDPSAVFVTSAMTVNGANVPMSSRTNDATFDIPVRVKVCDPTVSLEANCTKYGDNIYKPTGLIQNNADKLRFATFSYLYDSNIRRDGGVLRARMKSVGPQIPVPGSTSIDNLQKEWDPATGIYVDNPDSADADATGNATGSTIANSGVINYLNKFGLYSLGYKLYDPVGEMYYAALRYLRHVGNVAAYSNKLTAAMTDGFPVITSWDDPIQYACQKNFIIGIGDENTHADANLPGSTIIDTNEPPMPAKVSSDLPASPKQDKWPFNVSDATSKVGALEGLSNLEKANPPWCCSDGNTFFIAGLAYAAHTSDLRPNDFMKGVFDVNGNPVIDNNTGEQKQTKLFKTTAATYWLDVMESNLENKGNQYWLAAKYGGFSVPDGYSTYGNTTALAQSTWNSTGDTDRNGDPRPDNYYDAGKAALMVSSLNDAFKNINTASQFSSSLTVASPANLADGATSYSTQYFAANWSGDVTGSTLIFDATSGQPTPTTAWNARLLLETQAAALGWDKQRFIATSDAGKGVAFRSASISNSGNAAALSVSGVTSTDVVNFLRGDRSKEGAPFRQRAYLLGDIVASKAVAVAAPSATYADAANPGYSDFKTAQKSRGTVVYVGANDGMLHAFDGTLNESGGKELFAYVPSFLFQGPTATPAVNGLASLTNIHYIHHFFVDATPVVTDIDFGRSGSPGVATTTAAWHSVLIGGLGKGGKGYYALDVSNPATLSNESNLAKAVLWEFTDATMGYSYGQPVVVKTAKYGWVVILTSGYNNADGNGYFYIVDPANGKLLEPPIPTGAGTASAPSGLAQASAYIGDYTNYTADAVYAGDLLGNLWRLDLTKTTGAAYDAPTKIASLRDSSKAAIGQPVTTRPLIEVDKNSLKRYVLIGTGKLLADSDIKSSQMQTFYAINDGTGGKFDTSATLPKGVAYPITRANLNADTAVSTGIGSSPANPSGWYIDLPVSSNKIAGRVTSQAAANAGVVAFAANLPDGDACTPSGSNDVYAVSYDTGKSQLQLPDGQIFVTTPGLNNGLYWANINGKIRLVDTTTLGSGSTPPLQPPPVSDPFNRLNWRQIPVSN